MNRFNALLILAFFSFIAAACGSGSSNGSKDDGDLETTHEREISDVDDAADAEAETASDGDETELEIETAEESADETADEQAELTQDSEPVEAEDENAEQTEESEEQAEQAERLENADETAEENSKEAADETPVELTEEASEEEEQQTTGDQYEPDDSPQEAASLEPIAKDGTAQIHDFADDGVDYIPFDCVKGETVFIMVVAYIEETTEYIVDENDLEVADFSKIDGMIEHNKIDRILWKCDETAKRFIKVINYIGRTDPDDGYSVRVFSPVPQDACEEDDLRQTACCLDFIPPAPQTLELDDRNFFDDNEDWLSFDGAANNVYTVSIKGVDDNVRPAAEIYVGEDDYPYDAENNFGSALKEIIVNAALSSDAKVYVRIYNSNKIVGVNTVYKVEILREAATDTDYYELKDKDTFENNDEVSTAESVPLGAANHFRFTYRTGLIQNDWDCVSFATTAGTNYEIASSNAVYKETSDIVAFRIYNSASASHYQSFMRGSSEETVGDAAGPKIFTAEEGKNYFACFYSNIDVDVMNEWADYIFTITQK